MKEIVRKRLEEGDLSIDRIESLLPKDDVELLAFRQVKVPVIIQKVSQLASEDAKAAAFFDVRFFLGPSVQRFSELTGESPELLRQEWVLVSRRMKQLLQIA